ncbi:MAG: hypothetical protein HYU67_11950 [Flavobacteriia bacterium]|nr:hypothetical protein [Flavobacteriia bacterium]
MKAFIFLTFLFFVYIVFSQNDTFQPSKNSMFVEYAGTGGYYFSLYYDRILIVKEMYRLSVSSGIGYFTAIYGHPYLSTPVETSLLLGHKNYFEFGFACSYIYGLIAISCMDESFGSRCASSSIYFIPRIGYRFQAIKRGLFVKVGLTPFVRIVEFNKNPMSSIQKDFDNMRFFLSL